MTQQLNDTIIGYINYILFPLLDNSFLFLDPVSPNQMMMIFPIWIIRSD